MTGTTRTTLTLAAILTAALASHAAPAQAPHASPKAAAKEPAPCDLLTPDAIKTVIESPVQPGQPGAGDCTWHDAKGETRGYLSLKDAADFHSLRSQMQASGRLVPVTGLAGDAFFVSSTGSSAALYTLKAKRVLLLTVDGVGYSKAQNEAAEKSLAAQILARL
ncbi:MAG TPA: hypothetical protein VM865_09860 [Acidobacteriaceae bacterium]|jgi:hypothetical protein|nr:hypothetical protein [Acidobacteriaceae bacterium]